MALQDYTLLTESELANELGEITTELEKRRRINSIPAQMEKLSQSFLEAEGIEVGDEWRQPLGAHDAYPVGWVASHEGTEWTSLITGNVWEPGVTGWREVQAVDEEGNTIPSAWKQPLGAHDSYPMGSIVLHGDFTWESEMDANVWEPGVAGWAKLVEDVEEPDVEEPDVNEEPVVPEEPEVVVEWIQPEGAHDAYSTGDVVTFEGKTWTSSANANVWKPGEYGWVENV